MRPGIFAFVVSVVSAMTSVQSGARAFRPATVGPASHARGRRVARNPSLSPPSPPPVVGRLWASAVDDDASADVPASSPSKAESILDEFHGSKLSFRIVVVGGGAILETTSALGPVALSSVSPKSGERLLTFASDDKSFEFHVKVEKVRTVAFVSVERPGKDVMRIGRFLDGEGASMCSLILADSSPEAAEWFEGMVERHGREVVM